MQIGGQQPFFFQSQPGALEWLAAESRAYTGKTCEGRLSESAKADFVCVAAVLTATGKRFVSQSAGDIYALIAYFWNYVSSLDDVPRLVQQFSRLQDIGDRMGEI